MLLIILIGAMLAYGRPEAPVATFASADTLAPAPKREAPRI